jgi:hypothetical protein
MTNEELLSDAETALNIAMNETQSSDEIQARAQASIAASLLVLARNSEQENTIRLRKYSMQQPETISKIHLDDMDIAKGMKQ